jgi:glycogen(starch) synthase
MTDNRLRARINTTWWRAQRQWRGRRPDDARTRVLHFGFEDPRRPGAGGGSIRLHEINKRLTNDFDITVVCARYPGSKTRVEDGVRYVHAGIGGLGRNVSFLTYFLSVPVALVVFPSDIVVEDFAAPFSSIAVPWLTRRPVIGVVQWLFAREKSTQYRLPFHLVERLGLYSHKDLIAVSDDLASELRERNADAEVTVISNGLDEDAFAPRRHQRSNSLYLGRLELAQKGLDLLIEAFAGVALDTETDLLVGGDGPDEAAVRALVDDRGLSSRVRFIGRVDSGDRFDVLASADVVVMPSRYETYGLVAAEALAVATPVVAFTIPCLRNLVEDGRTGVLVDAFDVEAFANSWRGLLRDPSRRRSLGEAGPDSVAGLHWDLLAPAQGEVYRRVLERYARRRRLRPKAPMFRLVRTPAHTAPSDHAVGPSV